MYNNYGMEIGNIFKKAESLSKELRHPYVGTEHLLLAILDTDNEVVDILKKYNLTFNIFKKELLKVVGTSNKNTGFTLYTPLLKKVINNSLNDASDNNDGKVTVRHLILSLLDEGEGIAIRLMLGLKIDLDGIYEELKISLVKKNGDKLEIYEIGKLLNETVDMDEKVIGRDKEIEMVLETLLRKKKSNPLLIGKAGVGKTAIVEELARRINKGLVPMGLLNKKIVSLEMGSLVAGTKYRGEFEERLNKIIDEVVNNKDIIVFIDEIHTIINAGGAEGAINASDILKPYLARGDIRCIGATTIDEYYKTINKDKALDRRFMMIKIEEPDTKETINIMEGVKWEYEKHHNISITKQNIKDIVYLADKYIKNKNNPDKSIDLLDMICSYKKCQSVKYDDINKLYKELDTIKNKKEGLVSENNFKEAINYKMVYNDKLKKIEDIRNLKKTSITKEDILKVIASSTNIPLLENKDEVYMRVKTNLKEKIVGQEEAIEKILRNVKNKLKNDKKILSLLLLGPSGVGKTYTVKLLADSLTNGNMLRLDMSEYNLETSVNKLIGVSAGYAGYNDDYVFRKVIDNPYTVILVDEIEKASPSVLNLFLQILDEGFVTNSKNEKIDFENTTIVMTSNITNKLSVGFNSTYNNNVSEVFSKEFLGRFDDVISYKSISKDILYDYALKFIKNKNINIDNLIKEANTQNYGFRNLKKLINKYNNDIEIMN